MSKERLTKREKYRLGNGEEIVICNHDQEDCNDSYMRIRRCKWHEKAMELLKKYEDLEDILRKKLSDDAVNVITASKEDFSEWLDRITWTNKKCDELAREVEKYRDLEEQGLLLRLPCKVGDTVYRIEKGQIKQTKITRYDIYADDSMWFCFSESLGLPISKFKTEIFLTQSEAEGKLREMKGEENGLMTVKEWLRETFKREPVGCLIRPHAKCKDGFHISIQAGAYHYCAPRRDLKDCEYTLLELGCPSEWEELIEKHRVGTIYPYVPIEVVEQVVKKHGGIVWSD